MPKIVDNDLERIATQLLAGNLVVLPTETVYGLAARADDNQAIAAIYRIKNRPASNPLILHCSSAEMAWNYVEKTPLSENLARHFWPGPLTMVLKKREDCYITPQVSKNLSTLAVRVPAQPYTRAIINHVGCPLAMPSANLSGELSPTKTAHVVAAFSCPDLQIVEGGDCDVGIESTVVSLVENRITILRPGSITWQELQLFQPISAKNICLSEIVNTPSPQSPGQLPTHYAPKRPLYKDVVDTPKRNEALLGFHASLNATMDLSPKGCLKEAARNLYRYLHLLDREPFTNINVAPIPNEDLGIAINDRLQRAANTHITPSFLPSSQNSPLVHL